MPVHDFGGAVPFLIEWGAATPHPARSLAHQSRLMTLTIRHARRAFLMGLYDRLGIDVVVQEVADSSGAGLGARVSTLAGDVSLTS
ncbi:MAG: hypothetical protein R2706_03850 [Acidimicrobiales bacterium]